MKIYKDMARQAQFALDMAVAEYTQNSQGSHLGRSNDFVSLIPGTYPYYYQ